MNKRIRKIFYGMIVGLLLVFALYINFQKEFINKTPVDSYETVTEKPSGKRIISTLKNTPNTETPVTEDTEVQENELLEPSFVWDIEYHYHYDQLSEEKQIWYNEILECLGTMASGTILTTSKTLDENDIKEIFECVLADHPELFYVDNGTWSKYDSGKNYYYLFSGAFNVTYEEAQKRSEEIEEVVKPILKNTETLTDDYDKIKYVYETIILNTDYDLNSEDNQNIYSVFINKRSVCAGYSKATQYLLNRMGVECTLISGTVYTTEATKEPHAWNLVKSNGSYYYIDTTWGDPTYQAEIYDIPDTSYIPNISYDYLNLNTNDIIKTHKASDDIKVPVCMDIKDNYYVREGAYFESYDREQMQRLFEPVRNNEAKEVVFRKT